MSNKLFFWRKHHARLLHAWNGNTVNFGKLPGNLRRYYVDDVDGVLREEVKDEHAIDNRVGVRNLSIGKNR